MNKILVTGGAGFIGSHLVEALSLNKNIIVIFDNLTTGKLENVSHVPHKFIKGDILDYNLLSDSMTGCTTVYHLAAATSVVESMEFPEKYFDVNSRGTLNVLKAARECGVSKVVLASSAAIYGDSPELPKTESMNPDPKSPYAISKLDGEYLCRMYSEVYGLNTTIARFFNVFGERQELGSAYASVIPIFISKIMNGKSINIYGDGEHSRDFIYVKDVVNSLIYLMGKGSGIFNVGYGMTVTLNSLVSSLESILNKTAKVEYVDARPGEIKHSFASVEKLANLGFCASFDFLKGLEQTVNKWW